MSTDLYRRLRELLPDQPLFIGTTGVIYNDGTCEVTLLGGGGTLRASNPGHVATGKRVFVQDSEIKGEAPELPYEEGEI